MRNTRNRRRLREEDEKVSIAEKNYWDSVIESLDLD